MPIILMGFQDEIPDATYLPKYDIQHIAQRFHSYPQMSLAIQYINNENNQQKRWKPDIFKAEAQVWGILYLQKNVVFV